MLIGGERSNRYARNTEVFRVVGLEETSEELQKNAHNSEQDKIVYMGKMSSASIVQ